MAHTCTTCGAVANNPENICKPSKTTNKSSFCGHHTIDIENVCADKLRKMQYVCDGCGRVAMEKDHLCNPHFIDA